MTLAPFRSAAQAPTIHAATDRAPGAVAPVEQSDVKAESEVSAPSSTAPVVHRNLIRQSLKASTLDGALSEVFDNATKGVLLSNFLVDLGAGPVAIGLLASIPLLVNLLQPAGAALSERFSSRHRYCLGIYVVSRSLWLLLAIAIFSLPWINVSSQTLIYGTLGVMLMTCLLGSFGYAAWMSWMAALVPHQLRGRYFGLRLSLAGLVQFITLPVGGWLISTWMGGPLQGYAWVLVIGIVFGLVALGCQFWIKDVNPKAIQAEHQAEAAIHSELTDAESVNTVAGSAVEGSVVASVVAETNLLKQPDCSKLQHPLKNRNFIALLSYLALGMGAMHLCMPFLHFYLLDGLGLDLRWVTLYSSLMSVAYLSSLLVWGRLADRIGNRPLLLLGCLLSTLMPLLWLAVDVTPLSLWVLLPLLHVMQGSGWLAMELCRNNLQLELAPRAQQSSYVAISAAVLGLSGAVGTTLGSLLAQWLGTEGMPVLFMLSAAVQLVAMVPLLMVKEGRGRSLRTLLASSSLAPLLPGRKKLWGMWGRSELLES